VPNTQPVQTGVMCSGHMSPAASILPLRCSTDRSRHRAEVPRSNPATEGKPGRVEGTSRGDKLMQRYLTLAAACGREDLRARGGGRLGGVAWQSRRAAETGVP
jgi:hypothetical protein